MDLGTRIDVLIARASDALVRCGRLNRRAESLALEIDGLRSALAELERLAAAARWAVASGVVGE